MCRISIVLCLIICAGCSRESDRNAVDQETPADVEDGGQVENADRDKAEAYFVALRKVRSMEEEKKLLTEFGEWLSTNDYKITVVEKNGKYTLSCPYFPPVTPWTDHTFFDIKNLDLLPVPTTADNEA